MADGGAFYVPKPTLTGRRGNGYTTGTSVPLADITAQGAWPGLVVNVPSPELTATGTAGELGQATLHVPAPQVTTRAAGRASFDVPVITLAIKAAEKASIEIPLATVTAEGKQDTIGTASFSVPCATVTAKPAEKATLMVPLASLVAHGLAGTTGEAEIDPPLISTAAHGSSPMLGEGAFSVPKAQVAGQGSRNVIGSASVTIPLVAVSPSGYVGTIGDANVTMPAATVDATGYLNPSGTATITVPLTSIAANVQESIILVNIDESTETVTGYALVLNLSNSALSEYNNYGFNSFAYFNGRYLGATSTGIFTLTGSSDNGTKIQATARTGLQDGGTANRKGIEDAFIGLATEGILTAKVIGDDNREYAGRPVQPRNDGIVTERVRFGKGIRSRYLGIEIENKAGCDFTIENAELIIVPLMRKI